MLGEGSTHADMFKGSQFVVSLLGTICIPAYLEIDHDSYHGLSPSQRPRVPSLSGVRTSIWTPIPCRTQQQRTDTNEQYYTGLSLPELLYR